MPSKKPRRKAPAKIVTDRIVTIPNNAAEFEALKHPGHLIRRLNQISISIFLSVAREYKLTQVQYVALLAMEHLPGIDQVSLSKLGALDRQTVSNVVQRLCEKGLCQRKKKDRRTNALYLTGAAKALIQVMRSSVDNEVDRIILAPLSVTERKAFMAMLRTMVNINNNLSRAPHKRTF